MARRSLTSEDVRRHNLSLVLATLARAGTASRTELAERTGLTRGAITLLATELLERGAIRESTASPASGLGRPRVQLELAADDAAVLVVLIDADRATAVVTGISGERLVRVERRHGRPMGDPGRVLDVAAAVVEEALADAAGRRRRILDASVVVWAPVGGDPPVVLADTDLEWDVVDLLGMLRERSPRFAAVVERLPAGAHLTADASVAAAAEARLAGDPETLLYVKADSGIGGALVVARVPGAAATTLRSAGSIGHIPVVPGGEPCTCGQRGCLVTVAGPDALLRAAGLSEASRADGLAAALDEFERRVRAGEAEALAAWGTGADELARALQIVSLLTEPRVIVLGGFYARLADDVAARFVAIQPRVAAIVPPPPVVAGVLGADAALRGAEHEAIDRALADPAVL